MTPYRNRGTANPIQRSLPLSLWFERNAVRLYAFTAALLALVAHYVPTLPVSLGLAVVAAGLGLSVDRTQVARSDHDEAVTKALNESPPFTR
ncbi:hypothetical protein [Streptomyces sp. NPDC050507]|uniref:hypothetical protein n=1 Tax=Streptomyces sp. NPDC050507 TaxID=3365619 RepID=UPI003789FD5E